MNRDDQKNNLQKTASKKVEYRNRPAHSQPRGRSMQAKKVKAKAKHRKRNSLYFCGNHSSGNYIKLNRFV